MEGQWGGSQIGRPVVGRILRPATLNPPQVVTCRGSSYLAAEKPTNGCAVRTPASMGGSVELSAMPQHLRLERQAQGKLKDALSVHEILTGAKIRGGDFTEGKVIDVRVRIRELGMVE